MDFDPRITSDGKGYVAAHGVHCNFHYGNVHDVFDEDAKNEEACVKALGHLIAKADAEIDDLEDKLAILQCQRQWTESDEHKNPFEVCCTVFQRRIDSLTSSMQRLNTGEVTISEIQRPAERICDIIDALIKSNFTEPEQSREEDLSNDSDLDVSFGSLNNDSNLNEEQLAILLELSMEPEKQTPVLKKLDEPTQIISEESSSHATRYMSKGLTEVRSVGSSNIEVSEKIGTGHASEGISGFLTSAETITSLSPLQATNDEGDSKATAPQHADTELTVGGSEAGESGSSILVAKREEIVKIIREGHDTSIQNDSAVSITRVPNREGNDSVEVHSEAQENLAQGISDVTSAGKTSGLNKVLKPPGHEVLRKTLDAVGPFSPNLALKPQKTIIKRKLLSIENFGQLGSPSSEIEGKSRFHPVTNSQGNLGTEEDAARGNPHRVSKAKNHQPKRAKRDFAGNQSPEVNVPEGSLDAEQSAVAMPPGGIIVALSNNSKAQNPTISELPFAANLEFVKNKLALEPGYLSTLTIPKLKVIAKLCNLRGASKKKKEVLIEELKRILTTL